MAFASPTFPTTLRGLRRWLLSVGLLIVLGVCIAGAVVVALVRQAPSWWRTTDPRSPETIVAGEEVENGVLNIIYAARSNPEEPWTVTLRAADANAWLSTRLRSWLANADAEFEWPDEVRDLQVEFDENLIQIGARLQAGERSQIVSAALRPSMDENGSLWVEAQWVAVGRMPVPADWLLRRADSEHSDLISPQLREFPETRRLLDAFRGACSLDQDPVIDLGDGRRVRLLRLAAQRGKLIVQCRTEFED